MEADPREGAHDLIDLNHRFALDGNNPNSYGGLLWCLGRFDRPFDQDNPVTGTIRERTTTIHAKRLNTERYAKAVRSRAGFTPIRVAVVGGGIAGLACARTLRDQGCEVTVYDKGRAVGGRLSTRETDAGAFDHGVPAFGVTDERFARFVRSWIEAGVCGVWRPTVGVLEGDRVRTIDDPRPLAVGTPGMAAVCAHLATDLEVEAGTTVSAITRTADTWSLEVQPYKQDTSTETGFDAVVLAGAAPQSARLLTEIDTPVCDALAMTESHPQWVLMGSFTGGDVGSLPDILMCNGEVAIAKIVREASKPGRDGSAHIVVHATAAWSSERYDAQREAIAEELSSELNRVLGSAGIEADYVADRAHRWGLARPVSLCPDQCAWDGSMNLAACGDGFAAAIGDDPSRIEDGVQNAFLSGVAAAGRVLASRTPRKEAESVEMSLF